MQSSPRLIKFIQTENQNNLSTLYSLQIITCIIKRLFYLDLNVTALIDGYSSSKKHTNRFLAVTNINDMQYENVFSSDAFHWYMEKKSHPYSSETKTHMPYK